MGLSGTKTKTTNAPSAYSKPYIDAGGKALGDAFAQTQPLASSISSTIGAQLPGLADRAFGTDPNLDAASKYNQRVLGGEFLDAGNPYLAGIASDTENDVGNRIQAAFGSAGRTGSGANQLALTKGLASTRNALYGAQYDNERSRMASAAALAPSLNASQYTGLAAYLEAANGAIGIPQQAATSYAGGLGSLFGGYNTQTQKSSPSLGAIIAAAAANAAQAYAGGGR